MSTIALRVSVPVVAGAALLAAAWFARTPEPRPEPPLVVSEDDTGVVECTMGRAVEKPTPGSDTYDKLAGCLEQWNAHRPVGARTVSVADVRYWVEVEHDPIWLEKRSWWLPMSGEGDEHFPSGIYITVPMEGTVCGGAIVN